MMSNMESKTKDAIEIMNKKDTRESAPTDIDYLLKSIPQLEKICNVKKKIGQGTFSKVFYGEAKKKTNRFGHLWAIKHLVPTAHPAKVLDEISCLKLIGGTENVIAAVNCMRNQNHIALIMPYVQSDKFQSYVGKLQPKELSYYMQQLLIALKRVHHHNYIHRDVKPSNFLYRRSCDRCALIDFGLVQKLETLGQAVVKCTESPCSNSAPTKRARECSENSEIHAAKRISIDCNQDQNIICPKSPNKLPLESPPTATLNKASTNGILNGSMLDSPSRHTRAAEYTRIASDQIYVHKPAVIESPRSHLVFNPLMKLQQNKVNGYSSSKYSNLSLQQVRTRSGRNELRLLKNTCSCFGSARVCNLCLEKTTQFAHRSGTPGFRAPEVLLKHPNQTAAVDMWSAGVILLCLLSGRYPFFQAVDDCSALAEISVLLGTQAIKETAEKLEKKFITSEEKPALSLFIVCETLRQKRGVECLACRKKSSCSCKKKPSSCTEYDGMWELAYPREFYDLLASLLDPNPFTRITASEALNHSIFSLCSE